MMIKPSNGAITKQQKYQQCSDLRTYILKI